MASADTATNTTSSKKKRRKSILDLFFSRNPKRAKSLSMTETGAESKKMTISNAYDNNKNKVGGAPLPGGKPSLEKSRKKEVKQRLNAEASKEIRPLAVGTLAMMVSALSNQGRL
jgi:hypothetical protein